MRLIDWAMDRPLLAGALSGMVIGVIMIIFRILSLPMSSDDLLEKYYSGDDVRGEEVEVVVADVGSNLMVGEYLWEDRDDISYVTFNETTLYGINIGDTVVVTVSDISNVWGIIMITISDTEVVSR